MARQLRVKTPGAVYPVPPRAVPRPPLLPLASALAGSGASQLVMCMKLRLLVEFDKDANRGAAVFPELPGCASAGDTDAEAVTNAKAALVLWFTPAIW